MMKKGLTLLLSILMVGSLLLTGCMTSANEETVEKKEEETAVEASTDKESVADDQSSTSIKFTDLAGRPIELDGVAERIFLGYYEESYMAVNGNMDNVVCYSKAEWADFFNAQYQAYEEVMPELKNIIDTGSIYKGSFSMETLLSVKPDVALIAPFQYDTLGENVQKLEESGVKVIVIDYNAQTVERHLESTRIIGLVTGNEDRAQIIMDKYQDAVDEVVNRVKDIEEKDKVITYVELGNLGAKEYGNSYGAYMWGNLIMTAGGHNIAAGMIESYGALSPEYILTSNPQVIFFAGSRWTNDTGNRVKVGFDTKPEETIARIQPYTERPGWAKLEAVKNNDIYAVDHAGLRSVYDFVYLQYIAKSLYPDKFEDIDPLGNLEDFYNEYLPIEPKGTFMVKYDG